MRHSKIRGREKQVLVNYKISLEITRGEKGTRDEDGRPGGRGGRNRKTKRKMGKQSSGRRRRGRRRQWLCRGIIKKTGINPSSIQTKGCPQKEHQ